MYPKFKEELQGFQKNWNREDTYRQELWTSFELRDFLLFTERSHNTCFRVRTDINIIRYRL